jgi:hypothetical protein
MFKFLMFFVDIVVMDVSGIILPLITGMLSQSQKLSPAMRLAQCLLRRRNEERGTQNT